MLSLSTWALSISISRFIHRLVCLSDDSVQQNAVNQFLANHKIENNQSMRYAVRRQWHWCIIWFPKFNHHRRLIPLRHATHLANAIFIFLHSPPVRWCHLGFLSVSIRIKILCHTSSKHIGMPFYDVCVCMRCIPSSVCLCIVWPLLQIPTSKAKTSEYALRRVLLCIVSTDKCQNESIPVHGWCVLQFYILFIKVSPIHLSLSRLSAAATPCLCSSSSVRCIVNVFWMCASFCVLFKTAAFVGEIKMK